jgi:hypothetical protein
VIQITRWAALARGRRARERSLGRNLHGVPLFDRDFSLNLNRRAQRDE